MSNQLKLLFTLSNALPKDDNPTFYANEIKPILEALLKEGVEDFSFFSLLGDTIPHICANNELPYTLNAIYQFCLDNQRILNLNLGDIKMRQTPISIAASMGNENLVKWFLDTTKIMLTHVDDLHKLPVFFAACYSGPQDVRKAIVNMLDPNNTLRGRRDKTGISAQIMMKNDDTFIFPDSESSPILRDGLGRTKFMMSVLERDLFNIHTILTNCTSAKEKKLFVDATDYCQRSALIYACIMGYADVVKMILPYADVNQADYRGQYPLHFAVMYLNRVQTTTPLADKVEIIALLLNAGAKNSPNLDKRTPEMFASTLTFEHNQELMTRVVKMINPTCDKSEMQSPAKTYVPRRLSLTITEGLAALKVRKENKAAPATVTTLTTTPAPTGAAPMHPMQSPKRHHRKHRKPVLNR